MYQGYGVRVEATPLVAPPHSDHQSDRIPFLTGAVFLTLFQQ